METEVRHRIGLNVLVDGKHSLSCLVSSLYMRVGQSVHPIRFSWREGGWGEETHKDKDVYTIHNIIVLPYDLCPSCQMKTKLVLRGYNQSCRVGEF